MPVRLLVLLNPYRNPVQFLRALLRSSTPLPSALRKPSRQGSAPLLQSYCKRLHSPCKSLDCQDRRLLLWCNCATDRCIPQSGGGWCCAAVVRPGKGGARGSQHV